MKKHILILATLLTGTALTASALASTTRQIDYTYNPQFTTDSILNISAQGKTGNATFSLDGGAYQQQAKSTGNKSAVVVSYKASDSTDDGFGNQGNVYVTYQYKGDGDTSYGPPVQVCQVNYSTFSNGPKRGKITITNNHADVHCTFTAGSSYTDGEQQSCNDSTCAGRQLYIIPN